MVNIEASVDHHHLPLRLYVDSCVATLTSDINSYPGYPFIDHQGWVLVSLMSTVVPPINVPNENDFLWPSFSDRFKYLHWCNKCWGQKLYLIRLCLFFADVLQTPSCMALAPVSCPDFKTNSFRFNSNLSSSTRTTEPLSALISHVFISTVEREMPQHVPYCLL